MKKDPIKCKDDIGEMHVKLVNQFRPPEDSNKLVSTVSMKMRDHSPERPQIDILADKSLLRGGGQMQNEN